MARPSAPYFLQAIEKTLCFPQYPIQIRRIIAQHPTNLGVLITRYSMWSRQLFSEWLDTDLLIRWFLDRNLDKLGFEHRTLSQNSERLLAHAVARGFSTRR